MYKPRITFCGDIGLFTINRGPQSCKFATSFCAKTCYNVKLYKAFKKDLMPDAYKNEESWKYINGKNLSRLLDRKRLSSDRIRFASRGEAISCENDIYKIAEISKYNHNREFHLPTRAWRSDALRDKIETVLFDIENLDILASIDPSNSDDETLSLILSGWSTIFFGDDDRTDGMVKCPKTWDKRHGYCAICKNGCFSKTQKHIHLKQH